MAKITGTLYKQTGSNALTDYWGEGYFLALQFNSSDWSKYDSVKVGLEPSEGSGLVEIIDDPDKNGVFKVTSPSLQVFKIVAKKGSETVETTYDLSDLEGRVSKPDGEIDTLWV